MFILPVDERYVRPLLSGTYRRVRVRYHSGTGSGTYSHSAGRLNFSHPLTRGHLCMQPWESCVRIQRRKEVTLHSGMY